MIITIPPWEYLLKFFVLDKDGDLRSKKTGYCVFTELVERNLSTDRSMEIADTPRPNGNYQVEDSSGLVWILPDFLDVCQEYRIFGTQRSLGVPRAT